MSLAQNLSSRERKSPSLYPVYSSGAEEVQVEELSDNDIGYDADVEILRPDQYEEVESETDEEHEHKGLESKILEDELALKLKQLYCDNDQKENITPAGQERGRKRRSKEMQSQSLAESLQSHPSEFEITELASELHNGPPMRRRKAKNLARAAISSNRGWLHNSIYQESSNSMVESAAESTKSVAPGEDDVMVMG